jgi:Periplasmic component of the Tol biopolymer transport system
LPYESGFWGYIQWLEPGVSVLAHNGFDDVVGLKIVNLQTNKEYQIVDTDDFEYLSSTIIPADNRLFISDLGTFRVYGSNGELKSDIPWPTDFDEYTAKYIAKSASQTDESVREIYYAGGEQSARFGPSHLRFSPDGKQLAYLLGAIGESVDDKVVGTRIALANRDGSGTKLITQNYARISQFQWTPDGTAILALVTSEDDREQFYIGMIQATEPTRS